MTAIDRSDGRARAVFWTLTALGAVTLVWRGRPQWFVFDDWTLLITRRHVWETSGVLDFLLLPHNEHLVAGLTLWDIGLASVFGIDSYLPWTITIVGVLVLTAVVFRRLMDAIGVPPILAAATAPVVMIWPTFGDSLGWVPETVFILYLTLGLGHLLLVTGDDTGSDRRAATGAALSTVALLCHSGAALTAVVVLLVTLSSRRWRAAAWSTVPLVVYGLWLSTWGRRPRVFGVVLQRQDAAAVLTDKVDRIRFGAAMAGQGFRFLVGDAGWVVWVLVVGGGCFVAWRKRREQVGRLTAGLVASSTIAVVALTATRSPAGEFAIETPQSRYAVLVVAPLLPVIALGLSIIGRAIRPLLGSRARWWAPASVALCTVAFGVAVVNDTRAVSKTVSISRAVRLTMNAVVSTPSTREARADTAVMPIVFDLDVAGVWSLVDWGWYHPSTVTDPETLLIPQVRFLVVGQERRPDDQPIALRVGDQVEVTVDGECVSLSPLSESNRTALVRGDGPSFVVVTDGAENVELQARRGDVRSNWSTLLRDPTTDDVRILTDPDVELVARLLGPATFCETELLGPEP